MIDHRIGRLRATLTSDPRRVLAIGENIELSGPENEYLARRRKTIAGLFIGGLASGAAGVGTHMAAVAAELPDSSIVGGMLYAASGVLMGFGLVAEAGAVGAYSGSAQYYADMVKRPELPPPALPNQPIPPNQG